MLFLSSAGSESSALWVSICTTIVGCWTLSVTQSGFSIASPSDALSTLSVVRDVAADMLSLGGGEVELLKISPCEKRLDVVDE